MRRSGQRVESFHPSCRVAVWQCLVYEISSLTRVWFLGAVLIALNFLAKGAWLASSIVKYLYHPPSGSGELLQVWSLFLFLKNCCIWLEWRSEGGGKELWKVKVQGKVRLMYLELILNWSWMQLGCETCEARGLLVQMCYCVISTTAGLQLTMYTKKNPPQNQKTPK